MLRSQQAKTPPKTYVGRPAAPLQLTRRQVYNRSSKENAVHFFQNRGKTISIRKNGLEIAKRRKTGKLQKNVKKSGNTWGKPMFSKFSREYLGFPIFN